MVDRILQLAASSRTNKLGDYALSTRDLVHFINDYEVVGLSEALKILEGKYDTDGVKDFQAQCMSLFRVNLEQIKLINHS